MLLAGSTRLLPFCIACLGWRLDWTGAAIAAARRRRSTAQARDGINRFLYNGVRNSPMLPGATRAPSSESEVTEKRKKTPRAATRIKRIARQWRFRFLYYLFPRSNSPSAPAHSTTKRLFSCDKQSKPSGVARREVLFSTASPFYALGSRVLRCGAKNARPGDF